MTKYYLAVDIGASSGRLILGHLENGKMELEEVHRFENGMVKKDGELCWEFDRLFQEIKNGLKKCKEIGKIPVSMGVDTWGVDFVLLDKEDKVLGNTVGYRDHRTEGMDEEVCPGEPVQCGPRLRDSDEPAGVGGFRPCGRLLRPADGLQGLQDPSSRRQAD